MEKITEETWQKILEKISSSNLSNDKVLDEVGVSRNVFYSALSKDDKIHARYEIAKKQQADIIVEKINDIAEECIEVVKSDKHDYRALNAIQNAYKNKMQYQQWYAGRLNTKYAEKQQIDHTVKMVDKIEVEIIDPKKSGNRN